MVEKLCGPGVQSNFENEHLCGPDPSFPSDEECSSDGIDDDDRVEEVYFDTVEEVVDTLEEIVEVVEPAATRTATTTPSATPTATVGVGCAA